MNALECDAENPSVYVLRIENGEPVYGCRCMVCARCNKHTGNSHQGHFWAYCSSTRTMLEFHFCCTNDCELDAKEAVSEV